ncbi:ATP-binding protein [Halomonas sp. SSL-5]|uniref:ATP-binding protein n=1 Tax=Halomonas sp. SSL-5 TaxID=3065855 RepID=UPI0027395E68|nr:ATP-binding protein [Halomonas sp. SSL-5]MDY7116898.1 ATP-binding protein [Halomonas sp. SSL-5]
MTIGAIPVDQRVIGIDSRRFASIEKALVELITNSDDSYGRLERAGGRAREEGASGEIRIEYERHQNGALLKVTDQAEGMSFARAASILTYGGAHSPLSRGEGEGRGFFGRGLKQAIYGLGHGWLETLHEGRHTRIELFRDANGGYLFDDGEGDRAATEGDHRRLGIAANGTRVTLVVENPQVPISQFHTLVQSLADNVYLRDILERRAVSLAHLRRGRVVEESARIRFQEPPALTLVGPEQSGSFFYQQREVPFTLTLKRSRGTELTLHGDDRTNGLVVLSGMAALDCQLFDYENQVGTEYLFGSVRCPALLEKLAEGEAIISDEREGLNPRSDFVKAFSRAVSRLIAPHVLAEQEKLKHLARATTSQRTDHMIEHLLQRMSRAAVQDLGLTPPPVGEPREAPGLDTALRFTTPFYYRQPGHPFHVALLVDRAQLPEGATLAIDYALPDSLAIDATPTRVSLDELDEQGRLIWTLEGGEEGARGEINVRAGAYWAWCEFVLARHASHHGQGGVPHAPHRGPARDHGEAMFLGYEFRNLEESLDRAVYSPTERKILINTGAPTVQLYVDGRGHFRDAARLLLAELFLDVIAEELATRSLEGSGRQGSVADFHATKQAIIRRYGSEVHRAFLTG